MAKAEFDLAIIGSGFAGSLLARIATRIGLSVLLLEKQKHPRFVIGESSTPLANLIWEQLCDRYQLADLAPLAKYGIWQERCAGVSCGLKRGFSFYHHQAGRLFPSSPEPDSALELLVAASPRDAIADTHWYRPEFDQFVMESARAGGAVYYDRVDRLQISFSTEAAELKGWVEGEELSWKARFVFDASGPRGFLARALSLPELEWPHLPATEGLYAHFRGIKPWQTSRDAAAPFPPDDAAQHHVFEGGWIWILRFNNGVTSAGIAASAELAAELNLAEGAPAWDRVLRRFPSLAPLWSGAQATTPFFYQPRLSYRCGRVVGDRWALLPSAAGFIDPLLSSGFPLTLLGVERLASLLETEWEQPGFQSGLETYARTTQEELERTEWLVAALYARMGDFRAFAALTLLYFAAASFSETWSRLNRPRRNFLLQEHPGFGPDLIECCRLALDRSVTSERLEEAVMKSIEPIDVAGLGCKARAPWYPVLASDVMESRQKLGASTAEIQEMMLRSGWV